MHKVEEGDKGMKEGYPSTVTGDALECGGAQGGMTVLKDVSEAVAPEMLPKESHLECARE